MRRMVSGVKVSVSRALIKGLLTFGVACSPFGEIATAWACGGGGITSVDGSVIDAQNIVISSRDAGTTDIVVHIDVPNAANSLFALLIPVPSEPTLHANPIPARELAALASATEPQIVIEERSDDGPSIGCGGSKLGGDAPPRVTAGEFVEIGPVVAVALKADTATAIENWLADNGFTLPATDTATLERYVSAGSYFIAVKRSNDATGSAAQSIGLHYSLAGDHRMLSLAFAKLGAAADVAFTLYLATKETTGPSAPFKALVLDNLDGKLLKNSYRDAVKKAVSDQDSKAFVVEHSVPAAELTELLPTLSQLFEPHARITRATTVIAREELDADVMFATAFRGNIPTQRRLSFAEFDSHAPSPSWFGVVMVGAWAGLAFRRRKP